MHKILTRATRRLLLLLIKIMAAVVGMVFVLAMLLVWRANQGPIVIDSIAPQLAQLLSNQTAGTRTTIDHAQLTWSRDDQALRLLASKVQVYDARNRLLAELPQLALGLNFLAPLHGQLAPLEIFTHDFTLRLTRTADGRLFFGDVSLEGEPTTDTTPTIRTDIVSSVRQFLQLEALNWFGWGRVGAIRTANVQLIIADAARKTDWAAFTMPYFTLVRSHANVHIRAALQAQLAGTVAGELTLEGDYRKRQKRVALQANFVKLNPAQWGKALPLPLAATAQLDSNLSGTATLTLDEQVKPQAMTLSLQGTPGTLNIPALWPEPQKLQGLQAKAEIDLIQHSVTVPEVRVDFDGVKLTAQLAAQPADAAKPDALAVTARAAMTDWPLDRVAALWPASVAPNPRAWITANMSKGVFKEVAAALQWQGSWQQPDVMNNLQVKGNIALENATIKYLEGMPPVTGVNGTAESDRSTMTIHVAGGKADRLVLGPSPIVITGLDGEDQSISIGLTGTNAVSDVVRLIDHPPLHYARAVGLSPEQVHGTAELDVKLSFPLLKSLAVADMQVDAKAKISDFASDQLVKSIAITQGTLLLAVDSHKMSVAGKAAYNGVPLDTFYQQLFAAPAEPKQPQASAKLSGGLSADDFGKLGLTLQGMRGAVPATLSYEKSAAGQAMLALDTDFTAAGFSLPLLNWQKPEKAPASGKLRLTLDKKGPQLKELTLKGPQLDVAVSGALEGNLQPKSLTCQPCKIGRNDLRLKLDFVAGELVEANVSGPVLDVHEDDAADKKPEAAPAERKPLRLKLDIGKLYQGNDHFFANIRGSVRRDAGGWGMIELRAVAEGRVPVTVALLPQPNGTRKLSITTDDFGDVLRAADITDQVHEGKLQISGNSSEREPYRIMGKIVLKDYRVRKLPVLAVLLNAASITGFADMMGGEGINFDRLEGGFDWNGQRVGLDDIRTAGGALGLNVEGVIDFGANTADLRGTVVPFSFFNSIISNIPIVGDIITGGKGGGLVAATYQAKGPLDKLDVSVNPVSFLAPGILRRIFFQN